MSTNPSNSVSHETLMNQMEGMGIESTTSMDTLGQDTSLPKGNISNETLELLKWACDKLVPLRK